MFENDNQYSNNENPYNLYETPVWNSSVCESQPQPQKEKKGVGRFIAIALCFSIVGSVFGAGVTVLTSRLWNNGNGISTIFEGERQETELNINSIDTSKVMTAAEIYAANVNSTVGITTSVTTNFFGYQTTSAASGSGFVLTADGYIVTNYHVIEGASAIKVTTYSGKIYEARVVGYDQSNDLAVLKIEAKDLVPVVLGDSDKMNVGDSVVAIGNPLGELTFSLTSGTVSALDREVTMSNGISMDLIQTDCAINSGNSGGALFNMYGEVIGITNAKYSSGSSAEASIDNIGFAIPMNNVKNLIQSIIEKGYIVKPYIGISIEDVSSQNQAYGLPAGAAVVSVSENSPAQKAGIKINDIITAVNSTKIDSGDKLKDMVADCSAGDVLTLTVYRQGQTIEIKVTVEEQRQEANQQSQQQQSGIFNPFGDFFG